MYFHCALKGGEKNKRRKDCRECTEITLKTGLCVLRACPFSSPTAVGLITHLASLQTCSLLKWSSAVVRAKNPESSLELAVHHQMLWEAPATCCCPKSKVCHCSKTLHRLQGVKSPPKEKFPWKSVTVGTLFPPSLWQLFRPS